jgi:hypothetical protein
VPFQALQQLAATGRLLPTDHVLHPGGKEWTIAGSLPGLFGKNPYATT